MGVVVVVTETRPLHLDVGAILVLGLPASFVGTVLKFNFFFFSAQPCHYSFRYTLWTSLVVQW